MFSKKAHRSNIFSSRYNHYIPQKVDLNIQKALALETNMPNFVNMKLEKIEGNILKHSYICYLTQLFA